MERFLVYGLRDPRTNEYRYIGKTRKGISRPNKHINDKSHNEEVVQWISELKENGLEPEWDNLFECDTYLSLNKKERELISEYSMRNHRLLNVAYLNKSNNRKCYKLDARTREQATRAFEKLASSVEVLSNLGDNLMIIRKELGLTQQDIADGTKLSRAIINKIEKGGNTSIDTLLRIMNYLLEATDNVK